jgi:hypothetical protein
MDRPFTERERAGLAGQPAAAVRAGQGDEVALPVTAEAFALTNRRAEGSS